MTKFQDFTKKVHSVLSLEENKNYLYKFFLKEDKPITKEFLDYIYEILDKENVIEDAKDYLANRFFTTKDKLIDGYFVQQISHEIYNSKYRLYGQDENKNIIAIDSTPYHTFIRVAAALARSLYKEQLISHRHFPEFDTLAEEFLNQFLKNFANFFSVMSLNYGFGAGRIMANAGSEYYKNYTTLINCTVMRQIPDSIEGIMQVAKEAALSLKAGAGVGYDFSSIRPKGSFVNGVGAYTSGVVSFAEIFDKVCSVIMSAGGRRGAQMAVIDIQHPESIDFFQAKRKDGTLRYFNISVGLTDKFMEAVENDEDFEQWFWELDKSVSIKRKKDDIYILSNDKEAKIIKQSYLPFDFPEYEYFVFEDSSIDNLEKVYKKKVFNVMKARKIYDLIMESTYDYAEPGVLFLDRINRNNPLRRLENIRATNPCGEQPLPFGGSCNLGSVFLHSFVKEPFNYDKNPDENVDWELLEEVASIMHVYLDAVNNISNLPLILLTQEALNKRRHGLGVAGLADMLLALGLAYSSEEARTIFEKAMKIIAKAALKVNIEMTKTFPHAPVGVTLQDWLDSPHYSFLKEEEFVKEIENKSYFFLRFSHATSIAPTGTMSLSWGNNISNGIEPVFATSYIRNIREVGKNTKTDETVYNFAVVWFKNKYEKENNIKIEDVTPYMKNLQTTNDLDVESHILIQASAQKFVDSSISKTCNIPTDYSFENFKKVYILAHKLNLKGFTTFRFNPKFSVGVLTKKEDLDNLLIKFKLEDGSEVIVKGSDRIIYDGEEHLASNLYEAIKEGIYGKM